MLVDIDAANDLDVLAVYLEREARLRWHENVDDQRNFDIEAPHPISSLDIL